MQRTIPVTVVIPVKNERKNLTICLERLQRFAKVLVVDSGSTDGTGAIALENGAELLQFQWKGAYPKKRNWVLMNHRFTTEWVLFLDADEFVDDAFCEELDAALRDTDKAGYWLNYTNYFLGSQLRHGLPQRKLALIRVGAGLYERIEEDAWSDLDMEIHEHPVLAGPVGELSRRIDHCDYRGFEKFLERHVEYAKWEAARYQTLHRAGLERAQHLNQRQRFKYRHLAKWWYPWFYFIFTYFVRLGILDGSAGFVYAFYKTWYFETTRRFILERDGRGSSFVMQKLRRANGLGKSETRRDTRATKART